MPKTTSINMGLVYDLCLYFCRHEKYVTQYRAVFVVNCKIKTDQVSQSGSQKRKRGRNGRLSIETEGGSVSGETTKLVCCSLCSTEVGVVDEEEIYHFFNVLPSECWSLLQLELYNAELVDFSYNVTMGLSF